MKKIDYTIAGSDKLLEKVHGYFDGIDSVIKELATEGQQIENELKKLESSHSYTAENLKKKSEAQYKLNVVRKAVSEALNERKKIQSKYWEEIYREGSSLHVRFLQGVESQLDEQKTEIHAHLNAIDTLLKEVQKIRLKANEVANLEIVDKINSVVKEDEKERRLLNRQYDAHTKDVKKVAERFSNGWKDLGV